MTHIWIDMGSNVLESGRLQYPDRIDAAFFSTGARIIISADQQKWKICTDIPVKTRIIVT